MWISEVLPAQFMDSNKVKKKRTMWISMFMNLYELLWPTRCLASSVSGFWEHPETKNCEKCNYANFNAYELIWHSRCLASSVSGF